MKKTIIIVCIGIVIGLLVSLGTYKGVKETAGDKFCILCHSMEPMVEVYKEDVHGGNNALGIKAKCVSCHLPQDTLMNYLYVKAKNGAVEVAITAFGKPENINWYKKRAHRKSFVYDSGCLSCHTNILEQTNAENPKQLEMHKHYESKLLTNKKLSCVSCHISSGHESLRNKLNELKPEYKPVMNVIDGGGH